MIKDPHPDGQEALIAKLQMVIYDVLKPLSSGGASFALLDFPAYANVGDSAIWLGELAFFKTAMGRSPAYVCTTENFSAECLEHALPAGPIFLSGGGNFGDIWPQHQVLREHVLQRFPDRKIIQLPQSIGFSDPAAIARTASIIATHPDFTLMVRDDKSFAFAKEHFACRVVLCPDMAFCLGALVKPAPALHLLLLLLRTDVEKVEAPADVLAQLPSGAVVADWLVDAPDMYAQVLRKTVMGFVTGFEFRAVSRHYRRERLYRRLAEARLVRGVRLLASADFVITDRLHAHIVCILLGLPHVRLDNSYGKLSGFAKAWTQELSWVYEAPDIGSAIARYHELRS